MDSMQGSAFSEWQGLATSAVSFQSGVFLLSAARAPCRQLFAFFASVVTFVLDLIIVVPRGVPCRGGSFMDVLTARSVDRSFVGFGFVVGVCHLMYVCPLFAQALCTSGLGCVVFFGFLKTHPLSRLSSGWLEVIMR